MNDFLILDSEHTTIEQAYGFRIPGYLIVQPKSPCTRIADLTPAQALDLITCIAKAESIITDLIQPERVYTLKFGEENPQIHFHIFPRTTRIEEAYLAKAPDAKPYSGARIIDWVWFNHLSFQHTDEEIQTFVQEAKKQLPTP